MEASVVEGVETGVESIDVRLLGPLTVIRNGVTVELPKSRKVRALLAYLALAPRPLARSHLCELLWDVPNDPRGELRWCLSKIRAVLGPRVVSRGDTVALDLAGCRVDALHGVVFEGEFLEGLEIDRSATFNAWLIAQRRRFRDLHAAHLERLVEASPEGEGLEHLEKWLQAAPFERRVHEKLLATLARRGRIREGHAHVEVASRLFAGEGLDYTFLRDAWRGARARGVMA